MTDASIAAKRRPRGTLVHPKRVGFTLEGDAIAHMATLADRLGVTQSALVQWLLEHMPLDADGIPIGWRETYPYQPQQQLHLKTA